MNRKELVDAIQKQTAVSRADVERVLSSLIQQTQLAVKKGERVALVGFGTFERRDRKARTARNPRTGEVVKVRATRVPAFRPGQGFKDVVSGKAPASSSRPSGAARPAGARSAARSGGRGTAGKAATSRAAAPRKSGARRR